MANLSFKPKVVVKKLLDVLPERGRSVLLSRYGLGKDAAKMTLEAIGDKYGITRERVRQIENASITNIRKSAEFKQEAKVFEELKNLFLCLGGIVSEEDFLNHITTKDKALQNQIHFLLVIGDPFKKLREDNDFKHRWHVDDSHAKKIEEALKKLYKGLKDDELMPESEMISNFLEHLNDVSEEYKNEEVLKRWLSISKKISRNPLGEWGLAHSKNISVKGIRDYAYLTIRKHGSPIHFKEVSKSIERLFKKKAHVATTHNELIKDKRFVLVGRGLYALSEWGYLNGVVKDVIAKVLEKYGPLTKDEIIEKVLKERYVKENTIMVNLQNADHFKKDKQGKYSLI
ncbi:MAG TPA: sigma factor-like helix-turn-helix DNA-binding protein [Candidatus Paceibacterota bacterium]|nr:sigma factor-like helix-turn-helix DNA-binding protein [Candidatus Paceibacterota bacterium]